MKHFQGKDKVEAGFYFNPRRASFQSLLEGGRLQGSGEDAYYRVPVLLMLVAGPLLGLLYAVFLPLVGFVMLGWALAARVRTLVVDTARESARLGRPAWQPLRAFFSRGKAARSKGAERDEWADKARRDLEGEGRDRSE
jgi:hypothetical protein